MRRNGLLIGGWALATLLALVLGLQGVQSVSNSVTDPRPAPLSPASVRAALQRTSSTTSSVPVRSDSELPESGADSSRSADGSSRTPSEVGGGDGGGQSSAPSAPVSGDGDGTDGSSSSVSSSDSRGSDGGLSSSEPSSSSSSSAPVQRTYQLVGGSVTIRFQNDAAYFVVATANNGFSVEHSQDGGTVDVRFESENHESRLRAYWDNGPQQEIQEEDRSD